MLFGRLIGELYNLIAERVPAWPCSRSAPRASTFCWRG